MWCSHVVAVHSAVCIANGIHCIMQCQWYDASACLMQCWSYAVQYAVMDAGQTQYGAVCCKALETRQSTKYFAENLELQPTHWLHGQSAELQCDLLALVQAELSSHTQCKLFAATYGIRASRQYTKPTINQSLLAERHEMQLYCSADIVHCLCQ